MEIEIRTLRRKDHQKAIRFAFVGMHFDWYTDSRALLWLYSRYFWYLELTRATQLLAAYDGDRLLGVLLAAVEGEPLAAPSAWKSAAVKLLDRFQGLITRGGPSVYEEANRELFARYRRCCRPDGEILFLAVDPGAEGRGIGSLLLAELENREQGKVLYLYTDNACTYQFYDRRGFTRAGETDIVLEITGKVTPLTCMLYSKAIPKEGTG